MFARTALCGHHYSVAFVNYSQALNYYIVIWTSPSNKNRNKYVGGSYQIIIYFRKTIQWSGATRRFTMNNRHEVFENRFLASLKA